MRIRISLDFDAIKDDLENDLGNHLDDLGFSADRIDNILESFRTNIDGGYIDATFAIELNRDETEVVSCELIGG